MKRVAFSPYSRVLSTTSGDGTAKLWDPHRVVSSSSSSSSSGDQWDCVATLEGHEDHVFDGAWSSAGDFFVTASHDKRWRLWLPHAEDYDGGGGAGGGSGGYALSNNHG